MNQVEHIMLVVKLNLKQQCQSLTYVIIVMHIFVKGNITVNNAWTVAAPNNRNKQVIFKNCVPFTECISEVNNTHVDHAKYIDKVTVTYNLVEYSENYSKTSGSLWKYCKSITAVNNNGDIVDFNGANATDSFKFKAKMTGQSGDNGRIQNAEIMAPLKCLCNFWRTLEMLLINCEVNLILTWSKDCVIMLQIEILSLK